MDKEKKREIILDAAEDLFGEKGFFRTTVDEVSQTSGIPKGTIYLYFKSKGDLFVRVILRTLSRVGRDIDVCANKAEKLEDILSCVMKKVRKKILRGKRHRDHMLKTGRPDLPPETLMIIHKKVKPALAEIKKKMAEVFDRYKSEIKPYNPDDLAHIFFTFVITSVEMKGRKSDKTALDIFLNGIKRQPRADGR